MKNLIYIFLFFISSSYITLPFRKKLNNSLTPENLMTTLYDNSLLTNITLGTPEKTLEINIKMRKYPIHIIGPFCKEGIPFFDDRNSSSFRYYDPEEEMFSGEDFLYALLGFDNFIIGKEKIKVNALDFYLASRIKYKSSGVLGLGISPNDKNTYYSNFVRFSKNQKLIQKIDFFFDFINENEGNLIIGELPHIYNSKKYDSKKYQVMRVHISQSMGQYYDIGFDNLTYGNKVFESNFFIGQISVENGLIQSSKTFGKNITESFFRKYLNINLCEFNNFTIHKSVMTSFVCSKDIDIKNFEDIHFSIITQKNIFTLTYKDVFMEFQGKIYFLIYFNDYYGDNWELGEIFLKKYPMSFDQENKRIGFYYEDKKNDFSILYLPWIIVLIFLFIIIFLAYVIYHLIRKMKLRKKRANELEDDYEYIDYKDKTIN